MTYGEDGDRHIKAALERAAPVLYAESLSPLARMDSDNRWGKIGRRSQREIRRQAAKAIATFLREMGGMHGGAGFLAGPNLVEAVERIAESRD